MKRAISLFFLVAIISLGLSQNASVTKQNAPLQKDTLKKNKNVLFQNEFQLDSLFTGNEKLKLFKKAAHASYYADKFHGKKTASGKKFDMNKYTAAHKKLPFGTKVKVTNEANGKSVIVEVTDRGPFVKSREIDLSKKAFMEITKNTKSGMMLVTLEVVLE
ncbi:septal ring lytic transglycosylase RlpA family protein [Flavobacterium sp.]|uniref:septal ring lytic transglycosylase RlpA family protein n=1 Tax=Flavobacterium sp. TaxID=239 RepID=UPI00286BC67F|nr:septal ring lytic transglycosylase RlpA family protein [Flavobacterium sp.]